MEEAVAVRPPTPEPDSVAPPPGPHVEQGAEDGILEEADTWREAVTEIQQIMRRSSAVHPGCLAKRKEAE